MADVLLRASFDQYAPLTITGKINPLRSELFVDIAADFKDMELSPFTPYSGTYRQGHREGQALVRPPVPHRKKEAGRAEQYLY